MSDKPYTTIVGLEIHIELNTASKMFSAAPNDPFFAEPNERLSPVCIGLPGTLPVPNREAIVKTIQLGLALGCTIPHESKFDRKHYFYPDLPKGYQISQYDQPLCVGGSVTVGEQTVRLIRIHLEEDAGKLLHGQKAGYTAVDLNRAGVPLVEIVTEPDLRSAAAARVFLTELRLIARTLGISEADMEKGQLRCDANVNVSFEHEGKTVKTYISEIKNLNSFRMVEAAITYEADRLYHEWLDRTAAREQTNKITVGWDNDRGVTNIQRSKEGAADYRYFPEPDVPPLQIFDSAAGDQVPAGAFDLAVIRSTIPMSPTILRDRARERGLRVEDVDTVAARGWARQLLADLLVSQDDDSLVKAAFTLLTHDAVAGISTPQLVEVAQLLKDGTISSNIPKPLFTALAAGETGSVLEIIDRHGWRQQSDEGELKSVILEVLTTHAKVADEYRAGKTAAIGFLVGAAMQATGGKANPAVIRNLLEQELQS